MIDDCSGNGRTCGAIQALDSSLLLSVQDTGRVLILCEQEELKGDAGAL